MTRFFVAPSLLALAMYFLLTACSVVQPSVERNVVSASVMQQSKPFLAQVVGVQWLNPLQRRDYSTEWQLLWTLGLVRPNDDDDMVKEDPKSFSSVQTVAMIAAGNEGKQDFIGYHQKYIEQLTYLLRDIYFSDSRYFYNAHSLEDKSTWRELAGIRVEYALPEGRIDPVKAGNFTRDSLIDMFEIGNVHFPTTWSRNTPPDVRITTGGNNAGFTSLQAGLDYLQSHPNETVWVMNWDAPSRPKDSQINENLVLLVLAGPNYKTERDALAWIGYPSTKSVSDFEAAKGRPQRAAQAWAAVLADATHKAGKEDTDIGFVIHDANNTQPDSSERIGSLAQTLTSELVEFDFMKQAFNTPALLGEMGAGTALTNVALGIAYANHFGKNVLVAGTSDPSALTGVVVAPPAKVRPINPDEPWFRARGEHHAYLMWWGLRHDAEHRRQGFSK